ncbi:hypothetical protein THOM_0334 [Trachipleistophora hominis]|uniref:Cullin family profile domain-containing protein n=1 Tax=Trachipleistophora hominis TaxID=72359 RepID=L7JYS6_TRAHO|nr:hypothetical protein THOM_0334 [Trachipleistophora hominis]
MMNLVYWPSLNIFLTNMFTNKPTMRYASILEIASNISLLNHDKLYIKKIIELIEMYINEVQYVDLESFVQNERKCRELISLLCVIFSPIKGLKLYKRYKNVYKKYMLKNIEELQNEILVKNSTIDEETIHVLKRYKVYNVVFRHVKKNIINNYFLEISKASDKKEELSMIFRILERESKGILDFKTIETCFLDLYLNKFENIYEISMTEKFPDLFNLFVRANQYNLFTRKFEECLNNNFSFEYMLHVNLFGNILGKFKQFLNRNEDIFIRNVYRLQSQPKKNLNFILESLNQIDTFEKTYRTYLANKILKREDVSEECDVMLEKNQENRRVTVTEITENVDTNMDENIPLEVFDIAGRGKMVMRNKIFRKSLQMIQNSEKPVLDFRWPKYEELTFSVPPEISCDFAYNKTLSTLKIRIEGFVVICTLFQYKMIKYVIDNYGNKNIIYKKIRKTKFMCIEDKRDFFKSFLKNKTEHDVFYDHIDPICSIMSDNLSFLITRDSNLCPDFRLLRDKTSSIAQNDDYKIDARIMRKLKRIKKCKLSDLYDEGGRIKVSDRVAALEQKGYCTRSGDTVNYCP